jgi:hypothetical protein
VQAAPVVPALDPAEDGTLGLTGVGRERRRVGSFLSEAKNASQTALSSAQPLAPIETAMPASRQRRADASADGPDYRPMDGGLVARMVEPMAPNFAALRRVSSNFECA